MTKKLTIREAVTYLRLSEKTIRRRIKSGELEAEKRGNQWFVLVNDAPNPGQNDLENGQNDQKHGKSDHYHGRSAGHDNGQPDHVLDPSALIDQLHSENALLRDQLKSKDRQIESLTESLDHALQLSAMSQKQAQALTDRLQAIEDQRSSPWWQRLFRR